MRFQSFASFALVGGLALAGHAAATGTVVKRIADISAAFANAGGGELPFDFIAKITMPGIPAERSFAAEDSSGASWFGTNASISHLCPTNAGDTVRIRGAVIPWKTRSGDFAIDARQIELIYRGPPPSPQRISVDEFYSGHLTNRLVAIEGVVYDVFRDEIDPPWLYIALNCNGIGVYLAIYTTKPVSDEYLNRIIGATVRASGIISVSGTSSRAMIGRMIYAHSILNVEIISPAENPFAVPDISRTSQSPRILHINSARCRATGHVVAVWDNASRILLKTDDGEFLCADLRSGVPPHYGQRIEVAGLPETDLYRINLSRTIWRETPGSLFQEQPVHDVTATALISHDRGVTVKNARLHGHAVRLKGIVRSLPAVGHERGKAYIECEQSIVPVDASACPGTFDGVSVGCRVEVTGTLVNETENWRPNRVLPQIREVLIAVRKPGDVRVLARPPWWTTGRLFALVGALVAVILGAFAWNVALRRRAELRGKELAAEQVSHVTAKLKVYERTRLAVELHDSLSQTLTGISMGLDSALDIAGSAMPDLKRQLMLTSKAVEACRKELRNCLWDLRSEALEASGMNDAIKIALSLIASRTTLNVRFEVPRLRLSDKTTHTILRIIRELTANAVRHGNATSIKIAGSIDGGKLRFSVTDNGNGFDPRQAPGVAEGHFGLEGIRERIDHVDGEVEISSSPGRGTKVTVAFDIPPAKMEEGQGNG